MSKTTLANLILECLIAQKDKELFTHIGATWNIDEKIQLANNALEERFQELIEAKVNQMLKRV